MFDVMNYGLNVFTQNEVFFLTPILNGIWIGVGVGRDRGSLEGTVYMGTWGKNAHKHFHYIPRIKMLENI